ncbi:helix-turn-helix domain-containing protein [Bacillus solimangrovi]|uniref:AraC family transcriptional regulator n=1 Tax=Bacillus solimangrovi TaxID=1305675 RepID=A0A1E5LEV3_9BACI|nr:helix-turn-helix domain-containing protein [Bacillus solimangrovi]OEH92592.1 AraC family transcriptional regulator [Bacillus solimangrovi]
METNAQNSNMGVLKIKEATNNYTLTRYPASEHTSFFVKHYWCVSWDVSEKEQFLQDVIPNPCVNLVVEHNKTGIFGPTKRKFSYLVKGKGIVFGVKFRPGGFYPFIKKSVSDLSSLPMNVQDVFGVSTQTLEETILFEQDAQLATKYIENIIEESLPKRDEQITFVNQIIDLIISEQSITKVEHLCDHFHIHKRKLQRIFQQYVGVSPKWVIKLYRLQNAAEIIENNNDHNWIDLSMQLGYYDQSHFIRDFKTIIGKTPEEYAK